MGRELTVQTLTEFLTEVGRQVQTPTIIVLLGGSGLLLLGQQRSTVDVDFDGEEYVVDEFRKLLERVAAEMRIELEAVPIGRFIPLPPGTDNRHIPIGTFGNLRVYIFDPYSITLSKLDRGFDTDIEDVVFLLQKGLVEVEELEIMIENAAIHASAYDLNPNQMRLHLALARRSLTED